MLTMVRHETFTDERRRQITELANDNADQIWQTPGPPEPRLKAVFDSMDCIYAVWMEVGAPHNMRIALLKGEDAIRDNVGVAGHPGLRNSHIRFASQRQAEIAWGLFGDGRRFLKRTTRWDPGTA